MTVQNVKIRSLGNSKLTEHPMSVSALTVLDPQPRLSVMSGLPVLPHSEKKKSKIHFIYLFIHSMHLYWLFPGTELGTTVTGLRRVFFK